MKLKSTLVVLALGASFGAMAHHTAFNTPYNATAEDPATNRPMAGHENVKVQSGYGTAAEAPDGTKGYTINAKEDGSVYTLRLRYNTNDKIWTSISKKGSEMDRAQVHLCVGPKVGEASSITVYLTLVSKKDSGGANKEYKVNYRFEPIELTDEYQHLVLASDEKDGAWFTNDYKDPTSGKDLAIHYWDLYVSGADAGQFVALEGIGGDKYEMPVLKFDHQATWEAAMSASAYDPTEGKVHVEEPGTYFIQAEDIAPEWVLGHLGHSEILKGLGDANDGFAHRRNIDSFWYEPDMKDVAIHISETFNGGMAFWQAYGADHTSAHKNGQDFALLGMTQSNADFGTLYMGDYIDETSNLITKEAADKGFGGFAEYVFEMEEDGYLDLSILAGPHRYGWYDAVIGGGTRATNGEYMTKYDKPREEGGYKVEGMEDDYLKEYGFSYIVYLDGEPLRTAWDIRPIANKRTGALTDVAAKNPLSWAKCTETDEEGNEVNSHHLWFFPNYLAGEPAGTVWWPIYKDHFIKRCYDEQVKTGTVENEDGSTTDVFGDSPFKTALLESGKNLDDYLHPDYEDVKCDAGRHVIRVQSCGGATVFDEMKLRAKKEPSTSAIKNVVADRFEEEAAADAPAEFFDLQGRRVVNPSNGIYIVKRGNKVTKQVIR